LYRTILLNSDLSEKKIYIYIYIERERDRVRVGRKNEYYNIINAQTINIKQIIIYNT